MNNIPTKRAEFIQRYQNIELDLKNAGIIAQLKQAGLSTRDIRELTDKDGHRLVRIDNKLREVANASRNNKINAEEAFFFFETKDKNGTWDSVDPNDSANPNRKSLNKRLQILGGAFEKLLAASAPTASSTTPVSPNTETASTDSTDLPALADLTLTEANDFFAQHPEWCYDRSLPAARYTLNSTEAKELWEDNSLDNARDLLTKLIKVGDQWQEVPTHIRRDEDMRLIAYQNTWKSKQRDMLRFIQPGEWYIGSSHHNPGHRVITRQVMQDDEQSVEMLKFNITHIRNYIGVRDTHKQPSVVATDSPRSYATQNKAGHVNPKDYPSILWRVKFPDSISHAEQRAYINNIRTWCMLMQKVTKFPPDYNGNDNLLTNTLDKVIEFGKNILSALNGSKRSLNKLHDKAAQVYCSESGMHLALNLGLTVPLNAKTVSDLFGSEHWPQLRKIFSAGRSFWKNNRHLDYYPNGSNGYVMNSEQNRMVTMEAAPDWLQPLGQRVPGRQLAGGGLVLRPWTTGDMVEHFISTAVPRADNETWDVSNTQANLLSWTKPVIFQSLGFGPGNPAPPSLVMLFDTLIAKVRKTYPSYAAFREAIQPELTEAHRIVQPRTQGEGAFVPPHMVISINGDDDELVALEPVGQLFHLDVLQPI